MAKASKKADSVEQSTSQSAATRRAPATSDSSERPAPSHRKGAVEGSSVSEATSEVRALCEQIRAARAEAAELLAALRSEAATASAEVAELRHQCRQTGEKLVQEIGEQSLALSRVRQAREQAAELAQGSEESRADIHAMRQECERAGAALEEFVGQSRTEYREALAEALGGVRRLKTEIESARATAAERSQTPEADSAVAPKPKGNRNRFGVTVEPGVVITSVVANGPAESAGLARGDVIEEANGRAVHTGHDLREAVAVIPDGQSMTLQLLRGEERMIRTVRIGGESAEGEAASKTHFGVTVAPGVVVSDVFPGSPAHAAGFARGDVIEDAHGQPIESGEQLLEVVHAQPEGSEIVIVVSRNGERRELVAHLDRV